MSSTGRRPLHTAASRNAFATANILVEADADVNAADALGKTPPHLAVECDGMNTVHLFLEVGADLHVRSNGGKTLLCVASNKYHEAAA